MIAHVLIDIKHHAVDQSFDYLVPKHLEHTLKKGMRIKVPFGTQTITGVIIDFAKTSDITSLKVVKDSFDGFVLFDDERLNLSQSLAHKYHYPRISYLNAMLPSALHLSYATAYEVLDKSRLPHRLQGYFEHTTTIHQTAVEPKDLTHIKQAIDDGLIHAKPRIKQSAKAKTITMMRLVALKPVKGPAQQKLINTLKALGSQADKKTLLEKAAVSEGPLQTLIKNGLIKKEETEVYRQLESMFKETDKPIELNDEQTAALKTIQASFNEGKTFLLHGVMASGKTEVYIKLIKALTPGQQALVLLPEIALTPKLLSRFKAALNEPVAVYHSGLSVGEQYDEWRRILREEVRVVIGTRSAIFSPLKNIGLIIIDEEQSETYIQQDHPEYDAVDVAQLRCEHHQCPLVLGSATPSVKRYYQSVQGQITRITLNKRPISISPPTIHIIDMKASFKQGNKGFLSNELKTAIQTRLANHEKTLLMINRRGHSWFVLCRDCGARALCQNCHISLSYHQTTNTLHCHHCGHKETFTGICQTCGSHRIRHMGLGTERVEQMLKDTFKEARVLRMDKDTTTKKSAHEHILYEFETSGDILVGTQMISKGLDFDDVTLVGVLSADMGLFVPSHYAESETFSLLLQIAGRSGRRDTKGDVYIQAYQADHPVLDAVAAQDYQRFYERDIRYRKLTKTEPFYALSLIIIKNKDENKAMVTAMKMATALKRALKKDVIGPADYAYKKINQYYQKQIIIRHQKESKVYDLLNRLKKTYFKDGTIITITHNPRQF